MSSITENNALNDDTTGREITLSKKECTSCEQNDVDIITQDIDSVAILDDVVSTCANCGKEGNSNVMNTCNKCKMVKYCNAACKKKHRKKHKKACENRAAELRDEKLFKQPPLEECDICMLPLPMMMKGCKYMVCCGKRICGGCSFTLSDMVSGRPSCSFCRTPMPMSNKEVLEMNEKRMAVNDPNAFHNLGIVTFHGMHGCTKDYEKALKLFQRAGELGHAESYRLIADYHMTGREGLEKDMKKSYHYYELAAMGGSARARGNLGAFEHANGNVDRAIRHYMIAISSGHTISLESIQNCFSAGIVTKEIFEKALRCRQSYLDQIRSDQRDKAAASSDEYIYYGKKDKLSDNYYASSDELQKDI